jgi:putative transposase
MARIVLPHYPHHIVQRGHNRQVTFAERADFERYLATLREFKEEYSVRVYAFCLMTNHVHLLLAPDEPTGIGKLMKRLAARQTRHHNRLEGRSGTLWEGRYKSSLVQREDYLLACCRYIELNPVRAHMVAAPQDYAWSSCRYRLGLETADWLDPDPCYLALGASETERRHRYQAFLKSAIPNGEWELIREAVQRGPLTGSQRFTSEVASILGRRVERRGQGRPAKSVRVVNDANER